MLRTLRPVCQQANPGSATFQFRDLEQILNSSLTQVLHVECGDNNSTCLTALGFFFKNRCLKICHMLKTVSGAQEVPFKCQQQQLLLFVNENRGIHSVNKRFLSIYSGPEIVLGTANTLVNPIEIDCQIINSQIENYLKSSVIRTSIS